MFEVTLKGILVSLTLIVAIGGQNVFVLRKGIAKSHIFAVCLTCFICDFFLMGMGIMGVGAWINESTRLTIFLALAGAVFLLVYALLAFKNAYVGTSAINISRDNTEEPPSPVFKTVLATLAITLLNPHVYLDTIVILGGISATLTEQDKYYFLIGSLIASAVWFFSLGHGARFLLPLFKKPVTWRLFDFFIGCIMLSISISLTLYAVDKL